MLYSHLNPLVYLIVLKKFQQYHIDVLIYCRNTLFFEEVSTQIDASKQIAHSRVDKQATGCSNKNRIKKFSGLLLFFVVISGLCLTIYSQVSREKDASLLETAYSATWRKHLELPKQFKIRNRIDYNQLQPYSHHLDENCDKNRAVFNYNRKRCYFVMKFPYLGYNLTESIEQCHSKGAILSYPRHHEEVSDVWTYFSSHLERTDEHRMKDLLANTTLHVGFRKIGTRQFQSVDEMLNVSTVSHPFMMQTYPAVFQGDFKGPAVCINRYQYLKQCMPRMRNQFAVCSLDF